MNQEEINKKASEKARQLSQDQIGQLVLVNIELSATKQVLIEEINILNNELEKLREALGKSENKE